jgi:hypothetical protein
LLRREVTNVVIIEPHDIAGLRLRATPPARTLAKPQLWQTQSTKRSR